MKRGMTVSFLLVIVLGIIILSIMVYVIYEVGIQSPLICERCKASFVTWCSQCLGLNWTGGSAMDLELSECVKKCGYGSGGMACDNSKDECKTVIPVSHIID